MLFMVIERFRDGNATAVYRRFREKGRMLPDGLKYLDSWVEASFDRCFQLMDCSDVRLLQQWVAQWQDLVEFEIVPVATSKEASEIIALLLDSNGSSSNNRQSFEEAKNATFAQYDSAMQRLKDAGEGAGS
jgi:uncharacterized protein DUF3303